jgi:hypothetical protein
VSEGFPRALSDRERTLLDLLLSAEFSGADALRKQAQSTRVRGLSLSDPTVLLLEVTDIKAPRAETSHTVPVETKVRDTTPPQEILLFVKDGLLDSIELVTYGEERPRELPAVESVEPPTINVA